MTWKDPYKKIHYNAGAITACNRYYSDEKETSKNLSEVTCLFCLKEKVILFENFKAAGMLDISQKL